MLLSNNAEVYLLLNWERLQPLQVGAAVADAASRPMHWLYDRTVLEGIVGKSTGI